MNPSEPPIDCARTGAATKIDAWPAKPTVVMIAVRRRPGTAEDRAQPGREVLPQGDRVLAFAARSGERDGAQQARRSRRAGCTGTHSGAVAETATSAVASGGATTAATL